MTFTNTNSLTARFITVLALISMMMTAFPVAFSVAEAAVSLTTATIDGGSSATVAPGATVTVDVSASKTGGGCENNWNLTRVTVDGQVYESSLGSITGTGSVSDSVMFPAPATPGDYGVLVELIGGGESFGDTVCDDSQVWDSEELTLSVVIDPYMQVLSISPEDAVKAPGDSITYTAEVELGGNPEVSHLQCVVFDIFRGDGWQTVDVDESTVGTYSIDLDYDLTGYATGTYDVIAIALDYPCGEIGGGFDTAEFDEEGLYAETTLTIEVQVEETTYGIDGYKWNDTNENGIWDEGEVAMSGWTIYATRGEETPLSTTTDGDGHYYFEVTEGYWQVTEEDRNGWTQTAPIESGYCGFEFYPEQVYLKVALDIQETEDTPVYESPNNCDFGNHEDETETETGPTPGGGNGIRISLTEKEPEGQVLGATTDQCGMYLYDYMREGMDNKVFEVQKLQLFLLSKGYYSVGLSGVFDNATDAAVRDFQAKNSTEILKPWVDLGLMENETPTGYVFKLTRWMINDLVCPSSETYPTLP